MGDVQRASYELDRELEIAEQITPEAPEPGAVIRPGYETDVDAVIVAVAECVEKQNHPELQNPRVCPGQAGKYSYFRKFTVGIRNGQNLAAATSALAALANCIEHRLEVVPHSNTWLGVTATFGLPGNQRFSENEDISRYKRNERRGTYSVNPTTRSFDLNDVFEQIVVSRGGEYGVRTDPRWTPRPLSQYFEKPARMIEIQIQNGHVIKRLEFFLWRSSRPDATPKGTL
jgi:hypothetical protein